MVRPVPALGLKAALSAGRRPRLLAALVLLRHRLVQARHHTTTRQRHILQEHAESSSWRTASVTVAGVRRFGFFACWLAAFTDSSSSSAVRYSSTAAMYTAPRRADAAGILAAAQQRAHTAHGEDQTGLRGAAPPCFWTPSSLPASGLPSLSAKNKKQTVIKCGWVPWLGFDLGKQREERRAGAGDLRPSRGKSARHATMRPSADAEAPQRPTE
ncbi:hypothetical protein TcBrA4_0132820 [Trypanosoma cruzi]|nr:hypothetical protein TcBrA4_0132820 [Trypanosoma cruzi]